MPKSGPQEDDVIPIAAMEKQAILKALQQTAGDKMKAAKLLGIGKTTLYRKLKEYSVGEVKPVPDITLAAVSGSAVAKVTDRPSGLICA
jgi:hypothetical protein